MKRKQLFIVTLCLMFYSSLSAQLDSFKLSYYKLPDLKRQSIDINFNANFNNYEFNSLEPTIGDSYSTWFESDINAAYQLYRNKRKYQGNHSVLFSGGNSFNLNKQEQDLNNDKDKRQDKRFSNSILLWTRNRFYFNNLFFIGVAGNAEFSHYFLEQKNDDYLDEQLIFKTTDKNKSNSYFVSLPLSIGKGRIEPVEDARHALYILGELEKNTRLTRTPTKEEILQIAANISEFKNERVLDSRLKKIYELKQMDSLLQSMGLIENADISYFATINDMWDYGGLQQRNAGYRIALEFRPTYNFAENKNETISEDFVLNTINENTEESNISFLINYIGFSYILEKPFNQKFQHTINTGVGYSETNIRESEGVWNISEDKALEAGASYYLGIYPTTRTDFSIGSSLNYRKLWDNEGNEKLITYGAYSRALFNYYFSPRLRLNFSYTFWYNKYEFSETYVDNDSERFRHETRITFLYSIF